MLTNEELLDFDYSRLADFNGRRAKRLLREQPDAYRAQLVAARFIAGWADRLERERSTTATPEWWDGNISALREVAAHLRQGDLIPSGQLHDEEEGLPWQGWPEGEQARDDPQAE